MLNMRVLPLLFLLACSFVTSPAGAQGASMPEIELTGVWRGTFNINIGGDREFIFTITRDEGVLSAVLDIPAQGIMGLAVESIVINGDNVRFLIPRIAGEYFGAIHRDRDADGLPVRMDGDWSQAGEYVPITLHRTAAQ